MGPAPANPRGRNHVRSRQGSGQGRRPHRSGVAAQAGCGDGGAEWLTLSPRSTCGAGAGGLSLGLHRASFDVLGVEHDADAVETHRANVGPCELADITTWHPTASASLVAGGVPCQSFSEAGNRDGTNDPRGVLYRHLIRIAVEANAEAILLENVRGMMTWRDYDGSGVVPRIEGEMRAAGYHPTHALLCAADYGTPQRRYRLFIVAFRSPKARAEFQWPSPSHGPSGGLFGLTPWVTVRQALRLGRGAYHVGRDEGANGWQGMRHVDVDAPAPTVGGKGNADKLSPLDRPACTITTKHDESGDPSRPSRRPQVELGRAVASVLDRPSPTISAGGTATGGAEPIANRETRDALSDALALAGLLDRPATSVCGDPRMNHVGRHELGWSKKAVRLTAEQCAALQGFPLFGRQGQPARTNRQRRSASVGRSDRAVDSCGAIGSVGSASDGHLRRLPSSRSAV